MADFIAVATNRGRLIQRGQNANLPPMNRRLLFALCTSLVACAAGTTEDDDLRPPPDGSVVDPDADAGVSAAKLLFFRHGDDGCIASAAGTSATPICPGATPIPSDDGQRVLCLPDQETTPLALYDLGQRKVIAHYSDWKSISTPLLSPDGSRVAFRAYDAENQRDVVRVMTDGEAVVADVPAFELLAFPSEDVVVVLKGDPQVVRLPDGEPAAVQSGHYAAVGPDPAGLVFEPQGAVLEVYFMDAETGAARRLSAGQVGGASGTKVVIQENSWNKAKLLDVADPTFESLLALPPKRFDEPVRVGHVLPSGDLLLEVGSLSPCVNPEGRASTRTTWVNGHTGDARMVTETSLFHRVHIDDAGKWAVVVDVDGCGVAQGTGRLLNLEEDTSVDLATLVPGLTTGRLRGAEVSADGSFAALALNTGVTVLDLRVDPPVARDALPANASPALAGSTLSFR